MEEYIDQFIKFKKMINDLTVSGLELKEVRVEINYFLNTLDQSQLREIFIQLASENELGPFFNLITDHLTMDSITLLTLELRLINPELHKKYRRGLKHTLVKKERELQWMAVSKLEI